MLAGSWKISIWTTEFRLLAEDGTDEFRLLGDDGTDECRLLGDDGSDKLSELVALGGLMDILELRKF